MDPDKTLDLLGRIDTAVLYQPFVMKLNTLLNACRARGQDYVATSGLRTYAEQDALYAKGRTTGIAGHTVTNARGGYSAHNFGVSIDLAPHVGGQYAGKLNPDYAPRNYIILGEEAPRVGLEWGGGWVSFKDEPHIQLPLRPKDITWERMRLWYLEGELPGVYQHLDVRGPW